MDEKEKAINDHIALMERIATSVHSNIIEALGDTLKYTGIKFSKDIHLIDSFWNDFFWIIPKLPEEQTVPFYEICNGSYLVGNV